MGIAARAVNAPSVLRNRKMRITKEQLEDIIKEEFEKMKTSDVMTSRTADAKAKVASGVTDQERGIIQSLQAKLADAAASGNIATGRVLKLAQMLMDELSKDSANVQQESIEKE